MLRCIIIGSGHAAATLAIELRTLGWSGSIDVFTAESSLPYHRPPLSKSVLAQEKSIEDVLLYPTARYVKLEVNFHLTTPVESIDKTGKKITVKGGLCFSYDKLALCTGARPRELDVKGNTLNGVHYLRDHEDVSKIIAHLPRVLKAVVVGGGYVGLESAATLRKLNKDVTLIARGPLLAGIGAPELSSFYGRVHEEEGVRVINNSVVCEIRGAKQNVVSVITDDGNEIPCDLLIIGIGASPNSELASAAGLEVNDGVIVNEYAETSDKDIVSAGDCAKHPNSLLKRMLRIESVPNALSQAKTAARCILGERSAHAMLPWFWSDQYELKLQIAGLSDGYDQHIIRGDYRRTRSFAVFYFKDDQLISVQSVNRPKEFMLGKKAILNEQLVCQTNLYDDSIPIKELFSKVPMS